ncbi:retrovirus-related pol polyprotein from transposon TNT 1-94 [Tanacetum coccineum]
MKEVFEQMETEVDKCSVERKCFEIREKELLLESDRLLDLIISQDLVHTAVNSLVAIVDYQSLEPISPKLLQNREAHVDYLKHTHEHADTLREIVEQAMALKPLDSDLDSACKFDIQIQDLLVYVRATCPIASKQRVISSTSASGSKPPGNTKKNRISRPTSTNKKNKVEDHLRSIKSSLNKKNHVSEPVCDANVKHSILNANSKLICATCNECMFDAIHYLCVLDYLNDVNVRVPPKKPLSTTVVKKTPPSSNTLGKLKDITNIGHSNCPLVPGLGLLQAHDRAALSAHQLCVDLLKGSRGSNLYTMSLEEMMQSSPIYLLSKASKTRTWLWHRRLSHLNFGAINDLAKQGLVRGLPKLKYKKDHLCYACSLGKSKKHTHKPKFDDSIQVKLYLLHMDLCGPMRIESINGKMYIMVIIDDYSWFTWTLKAYNEDVRISHQTSVARTQQQNGVVERRNHTLVEATYTMLIFSKALLCLWAEEVITDCKLKPKADIGIFVGYAPAKKAYRIYNRQTCLIMETIHVEFDELTAIASEQFGSGPKLQLMTPGTISSTLVQK